MSIHNICPVDFDIFRELQDLISTILPENVKMEARPHISLSKTVYPKTHVVDPILGKFSNILPQVQSFPIRFESQWNIYVNEERTRFFLAVDCNPATNQTLTQLSKIVDSCLAAFGLETYYKDPRFHVSLASSSEDIFTPFMFELAALFNTIKIDGSMVANIEIQSGNRLTSVALRPFSAAIGSPGQGDMNTRTSQSTESMTFSNSSASNQAFEDDDSPDSRRLTHNEIERRRRDNQRERLEELRRVLPNLHDGKASMVATIVRAKEYIEQLQTRVSDLEKMMAVMQNQQGPHPAHGYQMMPPTGPYYVNPHVLMGSGHSMVPPKPGFYPYPPPANHPFGQPTVPLVATKPPVITTQNGSISLPVAYEKPLKRSRESSLSASSDDASSRPGSDDETKPVVQQSALLMPTADPNMFLFGHRDNMQNLFSAPLSYIMKQHNQKETDLFCKKCHKGVDNMIMIDCDKCHGWYHIKCIGLDPERIPVQWKCSRHSDDL